MTDTHRRFVRFARWSYLLVYGFMAATLAAMIVVNPYGRLDTAERWFAAFGCVCCVGQVIWGWRTVRWDNYRWRDAERDGQ
jgi:hypothetical protein